MPVTETPQAQVQEGTKKFVGLLHMPSFQLNTGQNLSNGLIDLNDPLSWWCLPVIEPWRKWSMVSDSLGIKWQRRCNAVTQALDVHINHPVPVVGSNLHGTNAGCWIASHSTNFGWNKIAVARFTLLNQLLIQQWVNYCLQFVICEVECHLDFNRRHGTIPGYKRHNGLFIGGDRMEPWGQAWLLTFAAAAHNLPAWHGRRG